jgi:DNA-binding transcriptional ArsR family regulator
LTTGSEIRETACDCGGVVETAMEVRFDAGELQVRTEVASELLKLLSNPSRLRIVCALVAGERSVGELADAIGASVPATSQHLNRMRREHAVSQRRVGTTVYYSLLDNHVAQLVLQALEYAGHVPPHGRSTSFADGRTAAAAT